MFQQKIQNLKTKINLRSRYHVPLVAVLLALLFGYPMLSHAGYSLLGHSVEKTLTQIVAQGSVEVRDLKGVAFFEPVTMQSFYQNRDHDPLWTDGKRQQKKAQAVLTILEESWTHGLNPDHYHVTKIKEALDHTSRKHVAELLLTDAVIRYGHDMTGMRIDPKTIRQKSEYWREPQSAEDILATISSGHDVIKLLEALPPQDKFYGKLQSELVRLSAESSEYDHLLPIELDRYIFEPGDSHRSVKSIRERLGVEYKKEYGPERFYDDHLASIVMKFQREHGLAPDGIIGSKTLALLNRSKRDQMEQIIANMERLRWLDQEKPDRYILVNIPSQMLWAIENGKTVHEMRVVAGLPVRQTKDFKAEVTGIRFNPTWTVPLSLKMADMLPKLKEDPYILTEKKFEMYRGYGKNRETIDPDSIDWDNITWREMNEIRMVQMPGDHNALGRVRVLMPNAYNIYLHDTNHKEFFARDERLLSSGCVRLSEPEKIAMFVLSRNKSWSRDKMDALIAAEEMEEVAADETLPVYILYQTIWQDERGQLVYGPDVYKRDRQLLKVLKSANAYQLPEILPKSGDTAARLASAH